MVINIRMKIYLNDACVNAIQCIKMNLTNYYLMNSWLNNNDVTIKYPKYIRDNIHIHKLSKNFKSIVYKFAV